MGVFHPFQNRHVDTNRSLYRVDRRCPCAYGGGGRNGTDRLSPYEYLTAHLPGVTVRGGRWSPGGRWHITDRSAAACALSGRAVVRAGRWERSAGLPEPSGDALPPEGAQKGRKTRALTKTDYKQLNRSLPLAPSHVPLAVGDGPTHAGHRLSSRGRLGPHTCPGTPYQEH